MVKTVLLVYGVQVRSLVRKCQKKKKEEEFILSFNKPILITEITNRHYNTDKSDDIKRKCLVLM